MKQTIDGQPRSTWYYRKRHPQALTFTEAARFLGITRQAVHRTAKRIGVKTAQEVVDYYHHKQSYQVSWEIIAD
jgi:predicted DNA-binding protein (UPF0251 family)